MHTCSAYPAVVAFLTLAALDARRQFGVGFFTVAANTDIYVFSIGNKPPHLYQGCLYNAVVFVVVPHVVPFSGITPNNPIERDAKKLRFLSPLIAGVKSSRCPRVAGA